MESVDLYLIRHGQSTAQLDKKVSQYSAPQAALSLLGLYQARALGKRFKRENKKFDYVFTSPYKRAWKTCYWATRIIRFPQTKILVDENLREQSIGEWEGKRKLRIIGSINLVPPKGESLKMVKKRGMYWFKNKVLGKLSSSKNIRIAVFTHSQWIRSFLHFVMGFDERIIEKIKIENTSVTKLRYSTEGWEIITLNDTKHLGITVPIALPHLAYPKIITN